MIMVHGLWPLKSEASISQPTAAKSSPAVCSVMPEADNTLTALVFCARRACIAAQPPQRQTDDQKENLNEKGADIEHEERRYR